VHRPLDALPVEVVEQDRRVVHLLARRVPADDLLLRVDALVQLQHRRVEVGVHRHLLLRLRVRHGEARVHLNDAVGADGAQQRADHAVLPALSSAEVVDDREEDLRVHLARRPLGVQGGLRRESHNCGAARAAAREERDGGERGDVEARCHEFLA